MAPTKNYLKTLLKYFEEEVMGEAYFLGLSKHFDGPGESEKLVMLAEVERKAAEAVRPLLEKHGLKPRDDSVLHSLGEADAEHHLNHGWGELMTHMSVHYPRYIDDFEGLERMAPEDDRPILKILTYHEVATIDFANREIVGDPDSLEPIRQYLESG